MQKKVSRGKSSRSQVSEFSPQLHKSFSAVLWSGPQVRPWDTFEAKDYLICATKNIWLNLNLFYSSHNSLLGKDSDSKFLNNTLGDKNAAFIVFRNISQFEFYECKFCVNANMPDYFRIFPSFWNLFPYYQQMVTYRYENPPFFSFLLKCHSTAQKMENNFTFPQNLFRVHASAANRADI